MSRSLGAVDRVWGTMSGATFRWHAVADENVERYAQLLSRLRREVGDLVTDPDWSEALRQLRFGLLAIAGTPLPMNHGALGLLRLEDELRRSLPLLKSSAPQFSSALTALTDELGAIAGSTRDPLGDHVRGLLAEGNADGVLILLRWPRRVEAVTEAFGFQPRLVVASTSQLREVDIFDRIVSVGPSTWFPSLLSAPRAKQNEIVHLRVTRDSPTAPALFAGSVSRKRGLHGPPSIPIGEGGSASAGLMEIDEELFRPKIEWAAIDRAGRRNQAADDEPFDDVEARLVLLADGHACYIEAEAGSRSTLLDLRASTDERVRQADWREIEPGSVIILRTEGGDDVSHLADAEMGARASALREVQGAWKSALRKQVVLRGYAQVTEMLRRLGSPLASPQNVQNWSSMSTIKTRDFGDFEAIMKLIGWVDRARATWDDMRVIHAAHLQAGAERLKKLRERIERADLAAIVSTGRADFEVPALGAGTLTAFRVEDISAEAFTVSRNQVDRPFPVGEALWHG